MKKFNLSEWLKDTSKKLVTRDGRQAEILKTDSKNTKYPIIGSIVTNGVEEPYSWTIDGKVTTHPQDSSADLFFSDENELNDFEREISNILFDREYEGSTMYEEEIEEGYKKFDKVAKMYAPKLLELAKEELRKESTSEYSIGYAKGCIDGEAIGVIKANENLPKWVKDFLQEYILLKIEGMVILSSL